MKKIEKTEDGYVALVDVLGFSDRIARDISTDELSNYMDCLQQATSGKVRGRTVQYVPFSDTDRPPNDEELAWKLFLQTADQIPFHRQGPDDPIEFDGFAVVPSTGCDANRSNIRNSIDTSVGHLQRLRSLAPNPKEQEKYKESIRWLNSVRGNGPAPK
jgi:hypothetical protein